MAKNKGISPLQHAGIAITDDTVRAMLARQQTAAQTNRATAKPPRYEFSQQLPVPGNGALTVCAARATRTKDAGAKLGDPIAPHDRKVTGYVVAPKGTAPGSRFNGATFVPLSVAAALDLPVLRAGMESAAAARWSLD